MFIVEKRDGRHGRVKTRKVAVGSKQRTLPGYVKSDWSSQTAKTDGVIITGLSGLVVGGQKMYDSHAPSDSKKMPARTKRKKNDTN